MAEVNTGDRNVISGNNGDGIRISGNSTGNSIRGNSIGTDAAALNAISNTGHGIVLQDDAVINNSIGGSSAADGNQIFFNLDAGLRLPGATASTASNNLFDQNTYRGNIGLAVDIGAGGKLRTIQGMLMGCLTHL